MKAYQVFKRRINYYETDKMKVVHHSNYIRFLEECRIDFLRQMELDYDKMEQEGVIIPVLSVECDFRVPVKFGDVICIVPKLESFSGVKFEMSYHIYSEDFSVLHNVARTSHCFVDDNFTPVRMKRQFPHIYEVLKDMEGKVLYEVQ